MNWINTTLSHPPFEIDCFLYAGRNWRQVITFHLSNYANIRIKRSKKTFGKFQWVFKTHKQLLPSWSSLEASSLHSSRRVKKTYSLRRIYHINLDLKQSSSGFFCLVGVFQKKKRQVAHCFSDMTEFACSAAHEPQSSINQIFDFTQEVITALKCYCITKNTMQASRHQDPS